MTKEELVRVLAKKAGVTQKVADSVLAALSCVVHDELSVGGEVVLPNVGKLSTVFRAERNGRNPKTGAVLKVDAHRAVVFRSAKHLKKAIA